MLYILQDGQEVTAAQIKAAFAANMAVLVHSNGDGHSVTGLMLDGVRRDTRGQCYSIWDEVWTSTPATVQEALNAAHN